ncbi:uncharacterized protein LOC131228932 [Magnolia sinica]|uniref:uncharacterized protein LOC131228932 n=1 Tax=Magnolia sinica TaxID=86752 RepID=UPI00265B5279|nr:uncharacterized protein LOC131228932 [Magnolia sinica]
MAHCSREKKPCIRWVERYFNDCLCNLSDEISFGFGLTSLLCWAVAEIPQIITNFHSKSSNGVSLAFLMTWVVGDIFNLVGCLLEPVTLPTQFYTALLYTTTTVVLMLQTVYYDHFCRWWKCRSGEVKSAVADTTKSNKPNPRDPSVPIPTSKAKVVHRNGVYYTSARSLARSGTPPIGSYLAIPRSGPSAVGLQDSSSDEESYPTRSKPSSQPNRIPRLAGYGTFIVSSANLPFQSKALMEAYMGLSGRRLLQENGIRSNAYGSWMGWIMAAIYVGGLVPQICLNIKRGSVEGLNPFMFIFGLLANATYVGSIVVRSMEWERIKPNMPWLLDSIFCVGLDLFILVQFMYYRYRQRSKTGNGEEYEDYEEAKQPLNSLPLKSPSFRPPNRERERGRGSHNANQIFMAHCSREKKPCIRWVERYFKDCLCNLSDEISFGFGLISLVCWGVAEIPQIITNFHSKSGHGVSLAFLMTWVVGDVFNLMGCLLEPATLPTQFYTALLYTTTTVVLVLQTVYYDYIRRWWKCRRVDVESVVADTTKSNKPKSRDQSMPIPTSARVSHRNDVYYTSARSMANSGTPTVGSYLVIPRSGPSAVGLHDSSSDEESFPTHSRPSSHPIRIPRQAGYGTFIVCSANLPFQSKALMEAYMGLSGRRLLQEHGIESNAFGIWLGWMMAAIYMGGRVPQIWLNIKRGNVEGLNPLMFIFALIANVTYVGSILVRSMEWERIKPNMPWLLDAIVCVALDLFIIVQFIYYRFMQRSKTAHGEEYGDYMEVKQSLGS